MPGAKEGKQTRTALCAVQLQQRIPSAKVLYASATGASTPANMAYMCRLGTFGMDSFEQLLDTLKKAGLGSLELFAMARYPTLAASPAASSEPKPHPSLTPSRRA